MKSHPIPLSHRALTIISVARGIRAMLGVSLILFLAVKATAATLYWDGGTTDNGTDGNGASAGGAGTWDTILLNWDAGVSPHVPWINANNDVAYFGGTAGTVFVAIPVTVGGVTFGVAGYSFTGSPVEIADGGVVRAAGNINCPLDGFALAPGNTTYRFGNLSTASGFANANVVRVTNILSGASNSVVIVGGSSQPVYLTANNTFGGTVTISPGAAGGFDTASLDGLGGGTAIPCILIGNDVSLLRRGANLNNAFLQRVVEATNTFTIYGNNGGCGNALDLSGTNGGRYLPNASLAFWDNAGTRTFAFTGTITPANNTYRFGGARAANFINLPNANTLTGPRSLVVGGQSTVRVRIYSANDFSGETLVNAGTLFLLSNLALQNSPINTAGGGFLDVSGDRQGLTPSTATPVPNPIIGGLVGSKDITSVFNASYSNYVTSLTLNAGAEATNLFSGVIADGQPATALIKTGPGTQILSGTNTYTGPTTVSNGTLVLNGSIGPGAVTVAGGMLAGNATIGGSVTVLSGGMLSPSVGTNTGRFSVSQLTLQAGATVALRLNGTNSGAYDQIVSAGDVILGWDEATLVITLGYTPAIGDQYTIIAPAISLDGFFAGLLPGATLITGGYRFQITYWVGNGNDVILTCLGPVATAPTIVSYGPLNGSSFPLIFSGASGQSYSVLTTTNLSQPISNWTILTTGTFGPSPVTFTDTTATNFQRYYGIKSP